MMRRSITFTYFQCLSLLGKTLFYEGCNITSEEFYRKLSSGEPVTTSQPSPADVMKMWDQLLKEHDEVVHVPMSSGLSASCSSAISLSTDYEGKVQIADNHRISVTQERICHAMQKSLQKTGKSAKEIKEILEAEAYNSSIYIAVDTLEFLKKGGRVTAAGAALGSVLNINRS